MAACLSGAVLAAQIYTNAMAGPVFIAGVACNGPFSTDISSTAALNLCSETGTLPAFPQGLDSFNSGAVSGAGNHGLGMYSLASLQAIDVIGSGIIDTQAWGEWFYDDFVITGTGSQSTPVLAALNLQISGALDPAATADRTGQLQSSATATTQFTLQIDLNGVNAGFGEIVRRNFNGAVSESVDGILVGHYTSGNSVADTVTGSQILLPVGTAFSVHVYANAEARASGAFNAKPVDELDISSFDAKAETDFAATVKFPSNGPVFLLPPGYSVYSTSAGIFDNRVVTTPQAVPEPSSLLLLALSCGMLAVATGITKRARTRGERRSTISGRLRPPHRPMAT